MYHSAGQLNDTGTAAGTEYGSNSRHWVHGTPTIADGETNPEQQA